MLDKQAQTIREAYQALDPNPVPPNHPRYYVEPPPELSPFKKLQKEIELSTETRFLLTAQHRQGKSTQLARLVADPSLTATYEIIILNAREELDLADIDYKDILILLTEKCLGKLSPAKLGEAGKVLGELAEKIVKGIGEKEPKLKGFPLWKALGLGARLGIETVTREAARKVAGPALAHFLQALNLLIAQVEKSTGKRVLFVIDELEKIPKADTARDLFCKDGIAFREIHASLVIPVPLHVAYSAENKASLDNLGKSVFLPHIKIRERNGDPYQKGIAFLSSVIEARVAPTLFEAGVLDQAIRSSGGSIGKLIQLLRDAALRSVADDARAIRMDHLMQSAQDDRNGFVRILEKKHWDILRQVAQKKQFPGEDPVSERILLFTNAVLEYMNGSWYDVYPVLEEILPAAG